jgi:D-serine dehydratase
VPPAVTRWRRVAASADPALSRAPSICNHPAAIIRAAEQDEGAMAASIREIDDVILDDLVKGIPGGVQGLRLGDVGRQGWNLLAEDLPLPAAVLKTRALDNNGRWMRQFLAATGALIAPHGKTTMCPQLYERQLADGAWAITVATVGQLQVCRHFGLRRLILANQPVGRQAVRQIVAELADDPEFELYMLADSVAGVDMLAAEAARRKLDRPVALLLEGGFTGGRTGVRSRDEALTLARAIAARAPWVCLRGVEGFEGVARGASEEQREAKVGTFLDYLGAIASDCQADGLFAPGPVLLSAGGSAYYDMAVERLGGARIPGARIVIRSGCYLTQDSAQYRAAFARIRRRSPLAAGIEGELQPALELWAYVQSRPEPGRLILTVGKRDISYDVELPVLLAWHRPGAPTAPQPLGPEHRVIELNDQHAHVAVPVESPLAVGDMIGLGVSHPCTTFDKWQLMFLVDDAYQVTGAVRSFF